MSQSDKHDTDTYATGAELPLRFTQAESEQMARPLLSAMTRGIRCKCPACGEGALFNRYLRTVDHCPACGEAMHHHRADDLPAYLNIFLVGHVIVGLMLMLMTWEILSMWSLAAATVAVSVGCAFLLMRPLKGIVVGAQWALLMHGFGGDET